MSSEQEEWKTYFKERNNYIIILIGSLVAVWLVLSPISLFFTTDITIIILIFNGVWAILCAPYFIIKIKNITKLLDSKKEEIVIRVYKKKTTNINEIVRITGIREDFVQYYLEKNDIIEKPSAKTVIKL